jgi:VCBS repeat-containing protein
VPYTVTDEHGASSSADLTITVTGTNDTPVAVADEESVDEDGNTSGNVGSNDTDADAGASLSYALNDPGSAPVGLVFNPDGSWTFDASSYDSLNDGQEFVLVVPYTVTDEHGASSSADFTITVTGTNDTPLANADEANVDEDGNTSGNVGANDTDADAGASLSYALNDPGSAPTGLTFNPDGSWTFDASSYDGLAEGEPLVLEVPYTATDQHGASSGATLTITVTGTNDPTVFTVLNGANVFENANGEPYDPETLNLDTVDVDGPDDLFVAVTTPAATDEGYGTYTLTEAGEWTYVLDNDNPVVDALNDNDMIEDSFTVVTADGTTQVINVTIQGVNDSAVITGDDAASITEDDVPNYVSGNLDSTDVDNDDDSWQAQTIASANGYGTLIINGDGSWTYTLDNSNSDVNDLEDDEDLTDTFTVKTVDGTEQTISITINGNSDFNYVSPAPFTGTGDPNDFDSLGNPAGQNTSPDATNGDDTLYGGAGNDTINGGNGNDTIYGGSGGDGLGGGGDIDKLFGGSGSDTITGGNANDILIGGYGADNLNGSNGADTFFYLGQKDTGDTISGFSQAEGDRIKFDSAFGFDSSDFMGSISTPGAVDAGKFGYRYDPLTNTTTVYVDTDGVFGADMEIKLSGNVALTSGDFLFGGI